MQDDALIVCGCQVAHDLFAEAEAPLGILNDSSCYDGHVVRDVGPGACSKPVELAAELLECLQLCCIWGPSSSVGYVTWTCIIGLVIASKP